MIGIILIKYPNIHYITIKINQGDAFTSCFISLKLLLICLRFFISISLSVISSVKRFINFFNSITQFFNSLLLPFSLLRRQMFYQISYFIVIFSQPTSFYLLISYFWRESLIYFFFERRNSLVLRSYCIFSYTMADVDDLY